MIENDKMTYDGKMILIKNDIMSYNDKNDTCFLNVILKRLNIMSN